MKKFSLYILLSLVIFGCSSTGIKDAQIKKTPLSDTDSAAVEKEALEHIVDASIAELNGQYAQAILNYQEALKLDPQPGVYYSISKNYLMLNKLVPALRNAKRAVELESENIDYNYLLANLYNNANMSDSSAIVLEKIIKLDSTDAKAYFNLGIIYETNSPIKALGVFNKLLDIIGPEWEVLVKIAELNERMGKVEETIKTVEGLLALNPSSLELQKILIEQYLKAEKYDKAEKAIEKAIISFPEDDNLIELKGKLFLKKDDWQNAGDQYIKLIHSTTIPYDSKINIGKLYFSQSQQDSTLKPLTKKIFHEIEKDSADWQVNTFLGEIYLSEENDSLAIEYFKKGAEGALWNSQLWIRHAGMLFDNGRYDEAIEQMEKAYEHFPDDFAVNLILGLSYSQKGDNEEALEYLKKSVALNHNDVTALSAYGFTLNQLKEEDDALLYLEKAMVLDPENVQLLGMIGLIYDNKKQYEKSDYIYERAVQIDSTDALVLNNFAYSLAVRGVRLDEALKMSEAAVEAQPDSPSYLDTIGWVHYKLGNYEKALKFISEAIEYKDDDATLYDHLGDVYFEMDKKSEALTNWEKALEIDSSQDEIKTKIEKASK